MSASKSHLPGALAHLPMPIIGSPLFIISNPKLVIAQCIAGVVGSMPALNARPAEQLEEWLKEITETLAAYNAANPDKPAAPFAINQIVHKSNDRLQHDMAMCVKYKVPIIITSLGAVEEINMAAHSYGGVVLHVIINNKHAHKAIEKGADGLIAVAAGAGGHAGVKSPFALIQEIRQWFKGPLALSGSIATGGAVLAAQAMGADFAYIGSAFIATEEARAADAYKQAIVDCNSDDIVYSNLFTGVHGNYLAPSIRAAKVHFAGVADRQVIRVHTSIANAGRQVIAMHTREQVAVDDVVGVAIHDGLLVGVAGARLLGGNEGRADVAKVRAHGLRRQHGITTGDGAAQRHRAIKPLADLLDQRKRALHARMAARTRGHGDQAIGALLNGLVRELVVDDVVQHDAAPAVHRLVHVLARTQAGDDDGHLVFGADLHVVLQPVVALVHDLVDGEGRGRLLRVRLVPGRQGFGDFGQPLIQLLGGAGIERRHGAHDARLALLDDQLGVADDEQRRANDGKREVLQNRGKLGHGTQNLGENAF